MKENEGERKAEWHDESGSRKNPSAKFNVLVCLEEVNTSKNKSGMCLMMMLPSPAATTSSITLANVPLSEPAPTN